MEDAEVGLADVVVLVEVGLAAIAGVDYGRPRDARDEDSQIVRVDVCVAVEVARVVLAGADEPRPRKPVDRMPITALVRKIFMCAASVKMEEPLTRGDCSFPWTQAGGAVLLFL
ncbi:MAG TPA: hypothetical protein PKY77_07320 [Phycisphaerae bacterium]|nr:hypothetical protein [Phycisphaerae bacterium]HRY67812.1 hypothetical protein [Phycisphaerae bacterium]